MGRLADWIIRRIAVPARVYRKGHLYHADGSLYMGRWGVFETKWLSARLHHIATPDLDRALHDHPWNFVSLVLSGGYAEVRPVDVEPCFWRDSDREMTIASFRGPGSIAWRYATDRHRVDWVRSGTYTLFVYFKARQWWGFYTPAGKIHWQAFELSCHAALQPGDDAIEERT